MVVFIYLPGVASLVPEDCGKKRDSLYHEQSPLQSSSILNWINKPKESSLCKSDSQERSLYDEYFYDPSDHLLQEEVKASQELREKGYLEYLPGSAKYIEDVGILSITKSNSQITTINELEPISPGFIFIAGGDKYEDCGRHITKGCGNLAGHSNGLLYLKRLCYHCYRFECPVCFEYWASHQAQVITKKFLCYALRKRVVVVDELTHELKSYWDFSRVDEIYYELDFTRRHKLIDKAFRTAGRGKRPIHCVVSFGEWDYSKPEKELRKLAVKVAKKVGLHGFIVVFHPLRRLDKDIPYELGNVRYSPHYHFVGFGWINYESVNEVWKTESIIFKRIGVCNSVYATLRYEFSHCAKKQGSKAYSYYGSLHWRLLGKTPKMLRYGHLCQMCGEKLQRARWIGSGEDPLENWAGEFLCEPGNWEFYDWGLRSWTSP